MKNRNKPPVAPLVPGQVVMLMRSIQFPEFNSSPAAGQPYGTPLTPRCDLFGLQYARTVPSNNDWVIQGVQAGGAIATQQADAVAGTRLVLDYVCISVATGANAQATMRLTITNTSTQVHRASIACPINDYRSYVATGLHTVLEGAENISSPLVAIWSGAAVAVGAEVSFFIGGYVI